MAVLGYTNSSFTVHFRGTKISAKLRTGANDVVNQPAVRVYADGAEYPDMLKEIVLTEREEEFVLAEFPEGGEHTVRVVKITEAGMSYVGLASISLDGELLPPEEDNRTKALFIGDSITCGYGIEGDGTEKTFPSATFTVERDGSTNLIRAVFMHDGEHLFAFNFVAGDEATLDTMLKGISVES